MGFSYFVFVGVMVDVGFVDLIDFFGIDSYIFCILVYMEMVKEVCWFMSVVCVFVWYKLIIVLKVGCSWEG